MLTYAELRERNKTNAVRNTKTDVERALVFAVDNIAEDNKCDPESVLRSIAARVEESYQTYKEERKVPESPVKTEEPKPAKAKKSKKSK